jgi:ATP-dependent Zn protease
MIRSLSDSINLEINKIIDECYKTTYNYLKEHRVELEKISAALLDKGALNKADLDELLGDFLSNSESKNRKKELEAV